MKKPRRILIFAAMVATLACLLCVALNAETYSGTCGSEGNNLTWSLDTATGVLKIEGTGAMEHYGVSNYAQWYNHRQSIKTIEISDSVTSIGSYAFYSCTALTSVTFGENSQLTSIGYSAFYSCYNLTSIEIPSSVTNIGSYAFYSCYNLTSIEIPSSVTNIGSYAFYKCTGLTSITFGENSRLTSIGDSAFYWCNNLTSIEIPSSVTNIGSYAFYKCTGLTSITFGENSRLTSIGGSAFQNCAKLTSIRIPSGVKIIEGSVFGFCENLQNVQLQYGVTKIGATAFYSCTKLTSIIIPASVTSIGNNAFRFCSLTSIKIYSKTAEIYDSEYTIPSRATIYGYKGSTAQAYATKYGRSFIETECKTHSLGDTYKHDATNHWQECTICGEKVNNAAHTGGTATCTIQAICSECSQKYGEFAAHSYSTDWKTNSTHHWRECSCGDKKDTAAHTFNQKYDATNHWQECSCGDKKDTAAHVFDNACDTSCNACSYTRTITHSYEQKHDENNHWKECTVCGLKQSAAAHSFSKRYNDTHHWDECSCGYKKGSAAHDLNSESKCTQCKFGWATPGDLNDDGKPDARDLVLMRKYIAQLEVTINKVAADINGDTRVDSKDLVMLRRIIAGLAG